MTGGRMACATPLRTVGATPAFFTFDGLEILKNMFFVAIFCVNSSSLSATVVHTWQANVFEVRKHVSSALYRLLAESSVSGCLDCSVVCFGSQACALPPRFLIPDAQGLCARSRFLATPPSQDLWAQNFPRKTVPTRENTVPTRCPHGAHYGAHYGAHCKKTHFLNFWHTRCVTLGGVLH